MECMVQCSVYLKLETLKIFRTGVNDRTNCPAIKGFDRTNSIFDWTLSVNRPLFKALIESVPSFLCSLFFIILYLAIEYFSELCLIYFSVGLVAFF